MAIKQMRVKWVVIIVCVLLAGAAGGYRLFAPSGVSAGSGSALLETGSPAAGALGTSDPAVEPYFSQALAAWKEQGLPNGAGSIAIPAAHPVNKSPDAGVITGPYAGKDNVLKWTSQRGWVEYNVDVPQAGLYELALQYYPLPGEEGGGRQPLALSLQINGGFQFREARSLLFEREFEDAQQGQKCAGGHCHA
ncbi:carbohydrate-binding protein [Paenibacillus durus]|uniref:hypothetical protein n=1 Tax=Paenibacillus durus TaxID=44251 RepID=UPI000699B351|nr:hypothetical protein [Paenibacillus durus]